MSSSLSGTSAIRLKWISDDAYLHECDVSLCCRVCLPHCVCHAARCMVESNLSLNGTVRSSAVSGKSTRVLQQTALECASALRLLAVLRTCGPCLQFGTGGATVQHVAGLSDCTPVDPVLDDRHDLLDEIVGRTFGCSGQWSGPLQ